MEVEKIKVERGKVLDKVKDKRRKLVRAVNAPPSGVPQPGALELPKSSDEALNKKHRLFVISSELLMESGEKSWRTPVPHDTPVAQALKDRLGYAKKEASQSSDIILVTDGRNKQLKRIAEQALGDNLIEFIVILNESARFGSTSGWFTMLIKRDGLVFKQAREDRSEDSSYPVF